MVHCGVFVLNAMPGLLGGILHVFALYALDFRHLHNKRGLLLAFFSADVVKLKLFSVTSKYYVKAGYYNLKVPTKDYHSIKDNTLGNQNQHNLLLLILKNLCSGPTLVVSILADFKPMQ